MRFFDVINKGLKATNSFASGQLLVTLQNKARAGQISDASYANGYYKVQGNYDKLTTMQQRAFDRLPSPVWLIFYWNNKKGDTCIKN